MQNPIYKPQIKTQALTEMAMVFDSIGESFFVKNSRGSYLIANHYYSSMLGMASHQDIIGLTDHDLYARREANTYQERDKAVLTHEQLSPYQQIVSGALEQHLFLMNKKRSHHPAHGAIILTHGTRLGSIPNDKELKLTIRERQCLCLILQGYSSKEVALSIALSPRTVDDYIHKIKLKLGCNSRKSISHIFKTS